MNVTKEVLEDKLAELGTVEEVARYLGVSKSRVYVLAHKFDVQTSGQKKVEISREILEKAVAENKSVLQIADELQVASSTIRRRMLEYGIVAYNPQKCKQTIDREKCIELLKEGKSNEEIANEFNCNVTSVRNFIGNHNLRGYRKKKKLSIICKRGESGQEGVVCKNSQYENGTKRRCFYGGKCGIYDCCDYLLMTGKRRKHDKDNPELCFCYVHVTKDEKRQIAMQKINSDRDVLIV
jgi:DNA-binding CsgD family transcriptional regulator